MILSFQKCSPKMQTQKMHFIYTVVQCLILTASVICRDVTVVTDLGSITGETETVIFDRLSYIITTFLGIPYAEAPVGDRRFSKPVKKSPFSSAFIAKETPPICIQDTFLQTFYNKEEKLLAQSEDCLYLNLYIPREKRRGQTFPVMIWIYGGGFQYGFQNWYNAKQFVALNDVILVTFNYRVSYLGFLSTGDMILPGNYGLWDQHMAIRWVHEHILRFNGDRERVTVFGESAGGASAVYHGLYEGSSGLFQRIIAQSGTANTVWGFDPDPVKLFKSFAEQANCLDEHLPTTVSCLRNKPVTVLQNITRDYSTTFTTFKPVLDNEFIKVKPDKLFKNSTEYASTLKQFRNFDIIMGVCSSEGGWHIDLINAEDNAHVRNGYTVKMFEESVITHALKHVQLRDEAILRHAILHQYINWSSPTNHTLQRQRAVDLMSDLEFNIDVIRTALVHSSTEGSGRSYLYVFDHKSFDSDPRFDGANNGEDMLYVLGFPQELLDTHLKRHVYQPATALSHTDLALSREIMELWTNFAKTGYVASFSSLLINHNKCHLF